MTESLISSFCPPEQLLRAVLDRAADGIILVDLQGKIRGWSSGAARIYGYARHEVLGCEVARIHSEGSWLPTEAANPGGQRIVFRPRGREDSVTVIVSTGPVCDASGAPIGSIWIVQDISDEQRGHAELVERERALREALRALRASHEQLKNTQLQLIQSAKYEPLGRIAAGVAHEVKNPLAVILTGLQLLQKRIRDQDPIVQETLADLEHAVKRANGIVIGLLDFATSSSVTTQAVDLEDVVSAALHLLRHEFQKRHVHVERQKLAELPKLRLDRNKIEQVLVNLMMNAMDATRELGYLTVRTSMRRLTEPGHGVGFRKSDVLRVGQTVAAVEIEDAGTGIPPEVLGRIFDPFFTTKPPGKGVGLGLAVCRSIVQMHGGAIWLENRLEGGTRATMVLPAGETRKEPES